MDQDRKHPRFILNCGKRPTDNNDSLTTPVIDPNAPLSTTGLHFPSFDHHTDNAFGQYLQELSQSVSSDVYANAKQDKSANISTTFPSFSSLTTSSIPTPAIKYNHRHQQSQHIQSQSQPQSQIQSSAQPQSQTQISDSHQLVNGQNNQSLNHLQSASIPTSVATSSIDIKRNVTPFNISSSPSSHDFTTFLPPKHGVDFVSNNSSHPSPMPVTVITTACLSSTSLATTTFAPQQAVTKINQRCDSTASPSFSAAAVSNLSINTNNANPNPLTASEEVPCSSSRPNHSSMARRQAPFSPVSTLSTSSQASTVGKESIQYNVPSGSDDEQASRVTPGRKKKMDASRRSKLTKKEKLDKIIGEEKRLQASNLALKQQMKVMERDFQLLHNIIEKILIDAARRKRSDSMRAHQEDREDIKES